VISITKSVSELERVEEMKRKLGKYYTLAIRTAAEYAIDLDPRRKAEFCAHLQALEAQAAFAVSDEEYDAIQASFRGELRSYCDFSVEQLGRLRGELTAAALAMQSFANDVVTSSGELESQVKEEIARLEEAASSGDVNEIRQEIHTVTEGLTKSYEQLARSTHLTIAQLQDELRALHQEMDQDRRSMFVDASSGAWIRQKLEERVERLLREDQPFWIMFAWAGLKRLEPKHSKPALAELRKALVKRMEVALEGDAFVARWSEEMFAAVIETDPLACDEICAEIERKLSAVFSVQEGGVALSIPVEIRMGAAKRPEHLDETGFYLNLGQVAGALAEGPLEKV